MEAPRLPQGKKAGALISGKADVDAESGGLQIE